MEILKLLDRHKSFMNIHPSSPVFTSKIKFVAAEKYFKLGQPDDSFIDVNMDKLLPCEKDGKPFNGRTYGLATCLGGGIVGILNTVKEKVTSVGVFHFVEYMKTKSDDGTIGPFSEDVRQEVERAHQKNDQSKLTAFFVGGYAYLNAVFDDCKKDLIDLLDIFETEKVPTSFFWGHMGPDGSDVYYD